MGLLKTYGEFFKSLNWKLVFAATVMLVIIIVIVLLALMIYKTIKQRRASLQVTLPDIKLVDKETQKAKPQFKENNNLTVEIVDASQDKPREIDNRYNNDTFDKILTMETKEYIPQDEVFANMPEIGELDVEALKKQKFEDAVKAREEQAERLRQIAKSDEFEEIAEFEELLNENREIDGGKLQ